MSLFSLPSQLPAPQGGAGTQALAGAMTGGASASLDLTGTFTLAAAASGGASASLGLTVNPFIVPHPLGLYLFGADRMGDGAGGRFNHGSKALQISYTILPPGSAALAINYHVQPAGASGLLIAYTIQPLVQDFSINNVLMPRPNKVSYKLQQVIGKDESGVSVRQGHNRVVWQYDVLLDADMARLMNAYSPNAPEVVITYPNEQGYWVVKSAMMHPPDLGSRATVLHNSVSFEFSQIVPD